MEYSKVVGAALFTEIREKGSNHNLFYRVYITHILALSVFINLIM